jgi:geranyl-CoA carboxylase beta subunit
MNTSHIDTQSDTFAAQRAEMLRLTAEVEALERKIEARSASQADRFRKRGQLLPRERLALLFDPGQPQLPRLPAWVCMTTMATSMSSAPV